MITFLTISIVAAGFLAYGLAMRWLRDAPVTGPLLFGAFGLVLSQLGLLQSDGEHQVLHLLAEVTLILVLFSDAAHIDLRQLRSDHNLPVRMLVIGLPLCVVLGAVVAMFVFPDFGFWETVLLAAILAPTDAALGQAVVSNSRVPVRIRQTLNVESGLNDGLALPAVLALVAIASMMDAAGTDTGRWLIFALQQLGGGTLAGVFVGFVVATLAKRASARGRLRESAEGIVALATAALAYTLAEVIHGNGFVAAFIGGIVFGNTLGFGCRYLYEFAETEGQLFTLGTFFLFGALLLPEALAHFTAADVLYAVASLTVIRMLPVALSLLGTGVSATTTLFLGWFGPRGLASILFVLLILDMGEVANSERILHVVVLTVALSILLHGVTAAPFANRYAVFAERMPDCAEKKPVPDQPFQT